VDEIVRLINALFAGMDANRQLFITAVQSALEKKDQEIQELKKELEELKQKLNNQGGE